MLTATERDFRVLVRPDGLAARDGTAWNVQLTRLLRDTERHAWGNWTLDPTIKVGALGWFDPTDDQFRSAHSAIDVPIVQDDAAVDWHLEQGTVRQTSAGVEFKVPYKDPSSGNDVTVGLQTRWEFGSKGSLASQGSACGTRFVRDAAQVLLERYQQIFEVARANNKVVGGDIAQGFGMITKVWLTSGCVNVGSLRDNAEFSMVGSVDGVAAMTGDDQSASLKGSFKHAATSDNVEKRIFPGKADVVASAPVAYAYEFSTFAGRRVIPRYVGHVSALNLSLHNGGSYIVDARVSYDTGRGRVERDVRISGGLTGQITDIPFDATNMEVRMDFLFGATQFLRVSDPLGAWYEGRGQIELSGWWPLASAAEWR